MPDLTLYCHLRYDLGNRKGLSRRIDVFDVARQADIRFDFMCSAFDEAVNAGYLQAVMADVKSVEAYAIERIEEATEGWSFTLTSDGVRFEGEYGQGTGGEVSLAQFKLAIQTFIQFLSDPEQKSIEVKFPEH